MKLNQLFIFLSCHIPVICGHMQLSKPLPVRSPLDDQNSKKDYSYTSPLNADGSDFPCKGYHNDPFRVTAQFKAGEEYDISIVGGATHGGGSCQLSLSYDSGQTFKVIKSMIGGCPLKRSYKFSIPADAPGGKVLFAWTWFNRLGNREMYMNCVHATVSKSHSTPSAKNPSAARRAIPFNDLPDIFVANANQRSHCKTIGGEEVVFPFPGPVVEHALEISGQSNNGYNCSNAQDSHRTPSPSDRSPSVPLSAPLPELSRSTKTRGLPYVTDYIKPTDGGLATCSPPCLEPSATSNKIIKPAVESYGKALYPPLRPTASRIGTTSICVPGTIRCDSEATYSLCINPELGHLQMGLVPAGKHCKGGSIKAVGEY